MTAADWLILALRVLVPLGVLLGTAGLLSWVERRGAALIQDRPGPNRVGPFGLLQPLADAIKFFFKEDIIPSSSDKVLYVLAPAIALFSALTTFAVIPYGASLPVAGRVVPLIGADVSIGVLYVFALTSSPSRDRARGLVLNSKFSLRERCARARRSSPTSSR